MESGTVIKFSPLISLYRDDERIVVMFDSACEVDKLRAVKIVSMPLFDFNQIEINVDNFAIAQSSSGGTSEITAVICLKVINDSGEQTRELAKCCIEANSHNTAIGYESAIRNGIAAAFMSAATAAHNPAPHFMGANAGESQVFSHALPASAVSRHNVARAPQRRAKQGSAYGYKALAKVVAIPIVAGVVFFLALSPMKTPPALGLSVPTGAQNALVNPSSPEAQLELTKKTLAQMGIDPGEAADMGCFAPK